MEGFRAQQKTCEPLTMNEGMVCALSGYCVAPIA